LGNRKLNRAQAIESVSYNSNVMQAAQRYAIGTNEKGRRSF